MKNLTFAMLFLSGILVAQEQPAPAAHLSETQRIALRTQAPPVKTHSRKHINKDPEYRVTENKSTIIAMVPYGK
jgi:hypothetical protein